MPPRPANYRLVAVAGATAALAAGFALGWRFMPPPTLPPTASVATTAPAKPPPPATAGTKDTPPPYNLRPLQNPTSKELAALEAWLASATCDEVWALVVDEGVPSPVVTALLDQRFRSFPAAERLALLKKHAAPGQMFYDSRHQQVLRNLMTDLLPARPRDAAFVAKHISDSGGYAIAEGLADWARQDFDAALAFANSLGIVEARFLPKLIGFLAEADMTAAQGHATRLPAGPDRDEALVVVGSHLARQDFATAVAWMQENGGAQPSGANPFESPLAHILSGAANRDAASVAALLLDQPGLFEGPGGAGLVSHLFLTWARQDAAAAAAWLQANPLPESLQTRAQATLFSEQLVNLSHDDMVSAWRSQPEAVQKAVARDLVQCLADGDPATVLDRVAAAFPDDQRSKALSWALFRVPTTDTAQVLRWLPDLIPHLTKDAVYTYWLKEIPPEQMQQALAQLPEADRHRLQESAVKRMLRDDDPESALAALPPVDPHKDDPFLYSHLASELVQTNPEKAAAWVAGFEEGTSKEWAAHNLVATWGRFDPVSASDWVKTLPPGNSRDRASVQLAFLHGITGGHTAALALAATVQDDSRRLDATGFALQRLWLRDRATAETAVTASRLTADQQRTLTTRLAKGEFVR